MRSLTIMAVIILTSATTFGATIIQDFGTGEIFPANDTISPFTVNQFNTSLGTLTKVTFEIRVESWGGFYTVENTTSDDTPIHITLQQGIKADLSASGYLVPGGMPSTAAIQSSNLIIAHTGDKATLTGPAYDHRIVSAPATKEAAPFALSQYEGNGTYAINFHSRQNNYHSTEGAANFEGEAASSQGFLTVIYEYEAVPEATSMALLALGIVAIGLRRGNFRHSFSNRLS